MPIRLKPPEAAATATLAQSAAKPFTPVKAMTPKQREAQLARDEQLDAARPALGHSKPVQKALSSAADQRRVSDLTAHGEPQLSKEAAPAAAAADPDFEGALWGSTYIVNDESQLDPDGVATALKANPPVSPQVYPNYRPGRTTWYVEAGWTEASSIPPAMLRMQLYRASDNQLVATRLTSRDTAASAETSSLCMSWVVGSAPKTCVWSLRDGLLVGKAGTAYYAKLSYATEMTNHFYQVPNQTKPTYREYWLPTKWTTAVTSPAAPAVYTPGISEGLSGQCTCWYQTLIADPVNTATGAVKETVTDAVVPGKGLPLTLSRSYSSAATDTGGLLGKGWKLPYEAGLTVAASSVTLVEPDGAKVAFAKQSDGTFTAPKPARYVLTQTSSGFTVTHPDHTRRVFDSSGRLTGWLDGAGQGLALSYSDDRLTKITDAAGRDTALDVDAATGRLSSVTLPDGRKVAYGYEADQLARVTGTDDGVTRYTYTGGRLATVVDPRGNAVTQNTYNETTGRILSQIDANGGTFSFTWKATADAPAGSGESNVTDPAGGIWTDVYEAGVLMRSYRPEGGGTDRAYDQNLGPITEYDSNANKVTRTFDARGNVASQEKGGVTEKFVFDTSDRIKSVTNGRGYSTTYEYDGTSDRVKTIAGPGGTTAYTYTAGGQIETETAPGGGVTRYSYNGAGLVAAVTAPAGGKTTYRYDAADRLTATTDSRGNTEGADPAAYTTAYAYDAQGRLQKTTDAAGRTSIYGYDANGNVKTVTDALEQVTAYEYNKSNQLTKVTGADGTYATTEYDSRGNQTAAVDEAGSRTTYGYDGAGRLASMTTPRGNAAGADAAKYTTTYDYDDNGNLTKTLDPTGALTSTTYDAFDRPLKVTDPLGRTTTTAYDVNGNVAQVTDPLSKVTKYTYTTADLLLTETDPLGKATLYGYDAAGNRTSVTTPLGFKTTYSYDSDGRQVKTVSARGNVSGADAAKYTWTTGYDAAGNPNSLTDPLGDVAKRTYDARGNVTSVTDPAQRTVAYAYDALSRLTSVTAPDDGKTSYAYDTSGNLTRRTDPNEHVTDYGYDAGHQLTSVTDPLNRKTSYAYDADGNLTKKTTPRGTTSQTWDTRSLLTKVDYSDSTPDVTYQYDTAGQLTLRNNGVLSEDFVYDSAGQLIKTRGFSYTYDAAGQILTRKYADGNTITNTYDADGRTTTMAADSTTTSYLYDPEDNLTRTTLPNTLIEDRAYDTAGRLTSVASTKAGAVITKTALTLSAAGQPTHIDTTRTGVAQGGYDLTYDKAGRITAGCFPQPTVSGCADTRTTTYSYDKAGNRLTATLGTRNTSYTYDGADQLISSTTGATTTDYAHDGEGNRTKAGANTYTYDLAGQISAANDGGIAYTYQHDAEGNLVTTSQAGTLTKRTEWDPNAPLPTLATEYDAAGAIQQSYRYDPLGQVAAAETGAAKVYTYTHDALGSPLDVTGSTGSVFQRWAYDPFGTRVRSTVAGGAPESAPSYAGAYFDTTTSHLDLRARQYDTFTGRFTRPDPLTPDSDTPYTQPYAYVENMPTSRVDPSGLCSITTQMKDLFSGNWGWNNNCDKEDRETATKAPAVQSAKNLADNVTKGAVEAAGQASLGFLDGLTFGSFSYLSDAQITCPTAYNSGLYGSMVPFPIGGGGKRLAAEGAEVAGRGLWTLTAGGASKIMKGGPFKTTFYKSASDGTWWTPDVTGHGGSAFKVYQETKKGLEWITDADKYGKYMPDKWKGGTGRFIPWDKLNGVGK
ncbi:DUF6531 domain-containing protein [Streptomyces sp. NPDC050535]|uniref:DUF6531 domain-containing protein n=1 Tax=Streptomyces sp. NPDC050535 TaxID=3365626 RepID=UPI0037A6EC5E